MLLLLTILLVKVLLCLINIEVFLMVTFTRLKVDDTEVLMLE